MKAIKKFIIPFLALCVLFSYPMVAQGKSGDVIKAYEKRMKGEVEIAKSILTNLLEKDSTNAMAHFEMARAIEDSQKQDHLQKALLYDPDNSMYLFYQANLYMLEAYKGIKGNETALVLENVEKCHEYLKRLLKVKPDCKESLLFLVEMYGALPEIYGGDKALANVYLKQLKHVDQLYAAQGELILSLNDSEIDLVKYWNNYISEQGESEDALIKLGKAQLMNADIKSAKVTFDRVIEGNPEQIYLYLDIARAHLYNAMRTNENTDKDLKLFKKNINIYLDSSIKKPNLLQAWCYGWLGMIEQRQGNQEKADGYISQAEKYMPNFPKFTAIPLVDGPPNVIAYNYRSYFTPF